MKQYLKPQLSAADVLLIAINLLPVWGVWFRDWNPKEIFLVYCLETVIAGLFNILRMWITTLFKKQDKWKNNGASFMVSGYFYIAFFIVHYGLFVFVQVTLFLQFASFKNASNAFDLVFHPREYLSPYALYLLAGIALSYFFQMLKDFVISGAYKTASLSWLMFQPYPRIFVQQFIVLAGSVFLLFGAGKIFIVIFAFIKIFFEVVVEYKKIIADSLGKTA